VNKVTNITERSKHCEEKQAKKTGNNVEENRGEICNLRQDSSLGFIN
jgi:hypothetical protein